MTKRSKSYYREETVYRGQNGDEIREEFRTEYDPEPKRFRRNKIDGVFGGVCAGIADYTGLDPLVVRIITVASFFMTGFTFPLYLALWIFVPSDKRAPYRREYREARHARRDYYRTRSQPGLGGDSRSGAASSPRRTASFKDVKSKFRSIETRLADLERSITSSEWQLRRQFRDLEK